MRITKIKVKNFKSLVDFEIDLSKFNCIIGLNGSGKSTFLQFMSFLSQLMKGNIGDWLQKRQWNMEDLVPHLDNKRHRNIHFEIDFYRDNIDGRWIGDFSTVNLSCFYESLSVGELFFEATKTREEKKYTLSTRDKAENINFNYQGSIFSQLADKEVSDAFQEEISYFRNIQSFDLLSPYSLRQSSKSSQGSIGYAGEDIASFLFSQPDRTRADIIRKIKQVYPTFNSFDVTQNPDGTKSLNVREEYYSGHIGYNTASRHVNDGLLRVLAMLAQFSAETPFLLLDEIENGINQEMVEFLVNELLAAKQQIVVTTHSALFLNFLDDDVARDSVQYFYKTPEGSTRCRKFFSIPSTAKKLGSFGPGEAVDDTNLYRLNEEIEMLDRQWMENGD